MHEKIALAIAWFELLDREPQPDLEELHLWLDWAQTLRGWAENRRLVIDGQLREAVGTVQAYLLSKEQDHE